VQERGHNGSIGDEKTMEKATRCVAKFAPFGQPEMTHNDTRSITACKLGQANPNELLVSWSVDLIYSFDILKDQSNSVIREFTTAGAESSRSSRKRKRVPVTDSPSAGPNFRRHARTNHDGAEYNVSLISSTGESVTIPLPVRGIPISMPPNVGGDEDFDGDEQSGGNEATSYAQRVRNMKNTLNKSHHSHHEVDQHEELYNIVKTSTVAFEKIDDYITQRTYPVTDSSSLIDYELKLRNDRAKVWRYAQASGTLARVLLQVGFPDKRLKIPARQLRYFESIRPAPREGSGPLERHEHFGYDFIKTVLLWLDSGVGAVLREFSTESDFASAGSRRRFPVSRNAGIDAIESQLIPYLENLATDLPVIYAGHGGTGDDPRNTDLLFRSEKHAVRALAGEMKRTWADLHGSDERSADRTKHLQDRRSEALKTWGWKVCFAILDNAAIDVNFPFVEMAFDEARRSRSTSGQRLAVNIDGTSKYFPEPKFRADKMADVNLLGGDADDMDEDEDDDDSDGFEYIDDDFGLGSDASSETNRNPKSSAGKNIPCTSHIRQYSGHCNCETTKDVNFYGLQDEYVVSGSDCGNLFIWEKKSGRLVNLLKGDCEVVNVIQRKCSIMYIMLITNPPSSPL
jgi:DDB1- and CUL4-associated factor 6